MSIEYYNTKATEFFESTHDLNMQNIYSKFEKHLSTKAYILDAGCGSGRDSKYFLEQGYKVDAIDASIELVKKASAYTGLTVKQIFFQELEELNKYDAIWSCASLLHVPKSEIDNVFNKFINSLKENGTWYMSFKIGETERTKDGRLFNDYTINNLKSLLKLYSNNIKINEIWVTEDNRPDRDEYWANAIVIKR